MPKLTSRKLALIVFAGLGSLLTAVQTGSAADGVIRVDDPYCCAPYGEGPCYTCKDALCRKFRLHCVYFRRCCTQRYVMLPQSMAPYCSPVPYGCPYGAPVVGAPPAYVR